MKKGLSATQKAAQAAEDGVTLARKTRRLDQRAWVGPVAVDSILGINRGYKVQITFRNTGRSFALDVGIKLVILIIPSKDTPRIDDSDVPIENHGIISPNGEVFGNKETPITLSEDQVRSIEVGLTSVYVHGRVEYKDIFDRPHWTSFCFILRGNLATGITYATYRKEYNQADDSNYV